MTAAEKRAEAVRLMKSRAGRNTYTNGGKRNSFFGYPARGDNGYSDCSSAVRACIKEAAGIDIGSNTDRQIRNYKKGVLVDNTSGNYPDESKLLPGDCLYFKGNTSHVKDVGHVEMYTGPNECWGHGSGIGPTRKNLKDYCRKRAANGRRYFCAIRWIPDDEEEEYAPAPPVLPTPDGDGKVYATVKSGSWNVRAQATKASMVLGLVYAGDTVRVYGEKDGFYGIKAANLKGYVSKDAFV